MPPNGISINQATAHAHLGKKRTRSAPDHLAQAQDLPADDECDGSQQDKRREQRAHLLTPAVCPWLRIIGLL